MNTARSIHWDGISDLFLEDYISADKASILFPLADRVRCRVTYSDIIRKVEYFNYNIRPINRLRIVEDNKADYPFKSSDRSVLDRNFDQRGDADDVIIVRCGRVTDTSIANMAFLKDNVWYTPRFPLLKGTKRNLLLGQSLIEEMDIMAEDIFQFEKIRLFNAMIDFGEIEIDVSSALVY